MNVSVTNVQFGCKVECKLVTHCSVFVQWSLSKPDLFNPVEGSPQSVIEGKLRAKGKGWRPARPARLHFNLCR